MAVPLLLAAVLAAAAAAPPLPPAPSPEALHASWTGVRLSPPSGAYTPEALLADLDGLAAMSGGAVRVVGRGSSAEGRPLLALAAGTGPEKVLLWSQMHGD